MSIYRLIREDHDRELEPLYASVRRVLSKPLTPDYTDDDREAEALVFMRQILAAREAYARRMLDEGTQDEINKALDELHLYESAVESSASRRAEAARRRAEQIARLRASK